MQRTAFIIMLFTILSKILGFGRDLVLSYFYGAGQVSDAFLAAQTIPNTLFSLIGTSVMLGFIPIYSRLRKESESYAEQFAHFLMTTLVLIASLVVLFGILFTETIVGFLVSGFDEATLAMTVSFTKIFLFAILANAVLFILRGYLQVRERYVITTLIGFPFNLMLIAGFILSALYGHWILPWAGLIATAVQIVIFIPDLKKLGYRYRFTLRMDRETVLSCVRLIMPLIIAAGFAQLPIIVERNLASGIAVGGITSLNYANRLNGFVSGLFITSITTVLYPMIAKMSASGQKKEMNESVVESLILTSAFVIPVSIGSALLSVPITSTLFGRGAFNAEALQMTSDALMMYSVGMLPFGLREILSKVLYAVEDTKSPLINTILSACLRIGFCYLFYRSLGIGGLAAASSISAYASIGLFLFMIHRKIGFFFTKPKIRSLLFIAIASILMGGSVAVLYPILHTQFSELIALTVTVGIAVLLYGTLLVLFRVDEMKAILTALLEKVKVRKR